MNEIRESARAKCISKFENSWKKDKDSDDEGDEILKIEFREQFILDLRKPKDIFALKSN